MNRKIINFKFSSNPDPIKDKLETKFSSLMSEDDDCLKDVISYSINSPHSSAFVDINGDCINDLLIHSKYESDQFLEMLLAVSTLAYIIYELRIYKYVECLLKNILLKIVNIKIRI